MENIVIILLVEDDPTHANLIKKCLRDFNESIVVNHVTSGEAALSLLNKGKKYDLIISNYDLPQKKGIEVVWRAREKYKFTNPVIMLIDAKDEGISDLVIKGGASRCVIKTEHYISRLPMVVGDCLSGKDERKEVSSDDKSDSSSDRWIRFIIDGQNVEGKKGETILEVAQKYGIKIPNLCYHSSVSKYGACRICMVEVTQGRRVRLAPSCVFPIAEGIIVDTKNEKVIKSRKILLELLMARCPDAEILKEMAKDIGLKGTRFKLELDADKCILCGLCVRVCDEVVGARALGFSQRGLYREISTPFGELSDNCTGCGECVQVCPTGALTLDYINEKIRKKKGVVAVKCDGCAGYDDRACVINCPTGALEDISIDEYLSQHEKSFNIELRELLRRSLEEEAERENVTE